jgi:hypothetical protein
MTVRARGLVPAWTPCTEEKKLAGEMASDEILLRAREDICPISQKERFGKVPHQPRYSTPKEPLLLLLFVSIMHLYSCLVPQYVLTRMVRNWSVV